MITVYQLRDDTKHIAHVQRATSTTEEYGIEPTHGLFGSEEWWQNIDDGLLPVTTLRGTISRVYMSGHNDWPEFQMCSCDGVESSWTRDANTSELEKHYEEGRPIEIDYVVQRHRPKSWDRGAEIKCVIVIRVADA